MYTLMCRCLSALLQRDCSFGNVNSIWMYMYMDVHINIMNMCVCMYIYISIYIYIYKCYICIFDVLILECAPKGRLLVRQQREQYLDKSCT